MFEGKVEKTIVQWFKMSWNPDYTHERIQNSWKISRALQTLIIHQILSEKNETKIVEDIFAQIFLKNI